jgi:membrane fusion protein, multidrug efflux system
MSRLKSPLVLLVAGIATATACGKKAPAAPPAPEVVVAAVTQQDVPVYSTWIGTLDGFVNATIQSQVSGYLLSRDYKEGSFVRKGDLLFQVDPRESQAQLDQAQGDLARAQASLSKANTDVARYTPLVAQQAISQQELDNALAAQRFATGSVKAAEAAVAQAKLNLDWTQVRAPIDGVAGIAQAQVGNLIKPNDPMTTISTVDPIKVLFNITEREYLKYAQMISQAGRREGAEGKLEIVLENDSVFGHRGRVSVAGRQVDIQTGTMSMQGVFPNPGNILRPGQYARVRAVMEVKKGALLVPQRAVAELQGAYQVGVVGADSTVDIRAVKPSDKFGSLWVIDQGLQPGDRVIVEGLQRVRPGMKVVPKDAAPADSTASARN